MARTGSTPSPLITWAAAHRADVAGGCAVPSLSAEVARADGAVRADYETALTRVAEEIAAGLGEGLSREAAWPLLAGLAGGVLLARAVQDKALAEEIAAATLANLKMQARRAGRSIREIRDGLGGLSAKLAGDNQLRKIGSLLGLPHEPVWLGTRKAGGASASASTRKRPEKFFRKSRAQVIEKARFGQRIQGIPSFSNPR